MSPRTDSLIVSLALALAAMVCAPLALDVANRRVQR